MSPEHTIPPSLRIDTLPAGTGWPLKVTLPTTVPPRAYRTASAIATRPRSEPTKATPAATRVRPRPPGQRAYAPAGIIAPKTARSGKTGHASCRGRVTSRPAASTKTATTGTRASTAATFRTGAGIRPGHHARTGPPSSSESITFITASLPPVQSAETASFPAGVQSAHQTAGEVV